MLYLKELSLLGILLESPERPTQEANPVLYRTLLQLGYDIGQWVEWTDEEIRGRMHQLLDAAERDIDYYDASELKVNEVLDRYLVELHHNYHNSARSPSDQIAALICAYGNKVMEKDSEAGVSLWVEQAQDIIDSMRESVDSGSETALLELHIKGLCYCERILQLVDVFVTAHNGMLAGMEEYAPADYNDVYPMYIPDFTTGVECGGHQGCECGCQMDHPIKVLEGLEDLLSGREGTEAATYAAGVLFANDIRLSAYQGNEEGVIDSIKEMGTKAYEWIKEALASFFDMFSDGDAEEVSKEVESVAEANKKAIQAMEKKDVQINDAAKKGIVALAASIDSSGAVGRVVAKLSTPASASAVLDGLQAILNKQLGKQGKIGEKLAAAKAAHDELKAANTKAAGTKEGNKDVVANAKSNVSDKIAKAKEKLADLRKAAGEQKKFIAGIKKCIKGIGPKIFSKDAVVKTDENTPAVKPAAKPATEPAAKPAAKGKAKK